MLPARPMGAAAAAYLLTVNAFSGGLMVYDKHMAETGGWRVPERTLVGLALAGGFPAGYAAMRAAHHKTRKQSFRRAYDTAAGASAAAMTGAAIIARRRLRLPSALPGRR